MASSLSSLFSKTIDLNPKKDPMTVLWRNVLTVGIEDLLKKKELQIKFDMRKSYSIEEMWFNHEDFDLICEYSELEPKIVKRRVYETIERMESIKTERLLLESKLVKELNGVIKKLNDEVDMLTKQKIYLQSKLKEKNNKEMEK